MQATANGGLTFPSIQRAYVARVFKEAPSFGGVDAWI
jgi:hypothetical protein